MRKIVSVFLLGLCASTVSAQVGNPGGPINDHLGEPDYGVCRGIDPQCFHDWPRAAVGAAVKPYRVLLYTHTAGPRHANLGTALGAGLNPQLGPDNVAQRDMLRIATDNGWIMDYTEDPAQMTSLSGYNAVIFLSTSREVLDDGGKTALRQYMRAGGGFVAIHNAFGTLYNWPWYEGLLGNANFYDHGPARDGDVVTVDAKDASTSALPARWRFHDEWYNLVPFPTHVRFLATVDEKSWDPAQAKYPEFGAGGPPRPGMPGPDIQRPGIPGPDIQRPGMPGPDIQRPGMPPRSRLPSVVGHSPGHGSFHPVTWCQYYDGGKVWATTLGHDATAFEKNGEPGSVQFQAMITGGIKSVMGAAPFCR